MKGLNFKQEGFSLVEVILSSALFALTLAALLGTLVYAKKSASEAGINARAVFIAEESLEAIKNIKDNSFSNLVAGTYGLSASGNYWTLSGSPDKVGIFTRSIIIKDIDADSKEVTAKVNWDTNTTKKGEISLITRFSNWK